MANKFKTKTVNEIKNYLGFKKKASAREITDYLNNQKDLKLNTGVTVLEVAGLMRMSDEIKKTRIKNKNYYHIGDLDD